MRSVMWLVTFFRFWRISSQVWNLGSRMCTSLSVSDSVDIQLSGLSVLWLDSVTVTVDRGTGSAVLQTTQYTTQRVQYSTVHSSVHYVRVTSSTYFKLLQVRSQYSLYMRIFWVWAMLSQKSSTVWVVGLFKERFWFWFDLADFLPPLIFFIFLF